MSDAIDLKCLCGAVTGLLQLVPGSFFHVQCLCCDCQQFAAYLHNAANILDEHGASELVQTYPSYMTISSGHEHMACMQLRENGLYRWHTTCCHMPLANTMTSAKMPFVGISAKLLRFASDAQRQAHLGPIALKAFGKYAVGTMPADAHPTFPLSFAPRMTWFMLKGMLTGKHTPSPFFRSGSPVVKASLAEQSA